MPRVRELAENTAWVRDKYTVWLGGRHLQRKPQQQGCLGGFGVFRLNSSLRRMPNSGRGQDSLDSDVVHMLLLASNYLLPVLRLVGNDGQRRARFTFRPRRVGLRCETTISTPLLFTVDLQSRPYFIFRYTSR